MSTPPVFAKKMAAVSKDMQNVERKIASAMGLTYKKAVQATLSQATSTGRLNVGKRGKKIGVRYTLLPKGVRVYMTGPAQLIERDTKPHRIPNPTTGRGRRTRQNRKPIFIPGVGVRAFANHPGTKGKHPWADGVAAATPEVQKVAGGVYFGLIEKHLG